MPGVKIKKKDFLTTVGNFGDVLRKARTRYRQEIDYTNPFTVARDVLGAPFRDIETFKIRRRRRRKARKS